MKISAELENKIRRYIIQPDGSGQCPFPAYAQLRYIASIHRTSDAIRRHQAGQNHQRMRRLISKVFRPNHVESWRPLIENTAREVVTRISRLRLMEIPRCGNGRARHFEQILVRNT